MSSPSARAATGASPPLVALVSAGSETANRIIRKVLGELGVPRVVEALDGAELLACFGERRPDLLVLDWEQPVVSAAEVVAYARDPGRSHAPDVPVVVTMADPTRSAVESALAAGVSGIVARPFSVGTLRARLAAALASPERRPRPAP